MSVCALTLVDHDWPAASARDSPSQAHLDVTEGDQFDVSRYQLDLTPCHIDRSVRGLDGPHSLARQPDSPRAQHRCRSDRRCAPAILASSDDNLSASSRALSWSTLLRAASARAWAVGRIALRASLGHGVGRLLHLRGGGQCRGRFDGQGFELDDRDGTLIDPLGPACRRSVHCRSRGGSSFVGNFSYLLGLFELAGETRRRHRQRP